MNRGILFQWDFQADALYWGRPMPVDDLWIGDELPHEIGGWSELVDSEDAPRVIAALRAVASGAGSIQLRCRLRSELGTPVDAAVCATLAAEHPGPTVLGLVQCVPAALTAPPAPDASDGADPRKPESIRAPGLSSVRVSDPMPGTVVVGADGRILCVNRRAVEILDHPPSDLQGAPAARILAPADPESFQTFLSRALKGDAQELEVGITRSDGQRVTLEVQGVPLGMDGDGRPVALLLLGDEEEWRRNEALLLEASRQDPLTRLADRRLLVERVAHAIARARRHPDQKFALLFLDLDYLKAVNDSVGHAAGDQLLIAAATRMRACVRPADTVARIGGDEFAILLEGVQDLTNATRIAQRMLQLLLTPVPMGDYEFNTSASIGVVLSSSDTVDPEQLLCDADTAMYRAKAAGRGRFEVFDQEMHTQMQLQLQVKADLRIAVERGEFSVHYEPVVSLLTGLPVGAEALLRWSHPQRGVLPPPEWLHTAEETGAIVQLDRWVLRNVCAHWRAARAPDEGWVAIRLSARQFLRPELISFVEEVLRDTNMPPHLLRFGVTEEALMRSTDHSRGALARLSGMGIGIHVDRFGLGCSSLGTMHELPITAIKLDRTLVEELDGGPPPPVIRTVLAFAREAGIEAIAEGISTREQQIRLRALGCSLGQGPLFSPSMPDNDLEQAALATP